MATEPSRAPEPVRGPHGEARVLAPDRRGVGKKVPRGSEQYHGFWRVVWYPAAGEGLSAPEVLKAHDEGHARELAERAVAEGLRGVADARF